MEDFKIIMVGFLLLFLVVVVHAVAATEADALERRLLVVETKLGMHDNGLI